MTMTATAPADKLLKASATTEGCAAFSWSPEVQTFYGDDVSVLGKMDKAEMQLGDRRMYFLTVERADAAEVRFFERLDDGQIIVSTWHGDSLGELGTKIAATVLYNRGVHCVGEQVKAVFGSLGLRTEGAVAEPTSPRAAFAHTIRALGHENYIRASVGLLC